MEKTKHSKLRTFIGFYKPHKNLFALDMVCALFIALIDLSFPFVTKIAMDELLPDKAYRAFFVVIGILLAAFILRAILTYIVAYLGHYMGVKMESDMRNTLFTHIQKLSFKFYDKTRTGHLMSRIINDLFEITELAHHGPEDLFISVITFTGAFILMLRIQWQLALVVAAAMICMVLFAIRGRRGMSKKSKAVKEQTAGINATLESSISGIRVAKAFTNESHEIRRFAEGNEEYKSARASYYRVMGSFMAGMNFFTALPSLIVIAVGGYLVMRHGIELSVLVAFTLYVNTIITPVRKLMNFVEQYAAGMSGFERYLELMNTEPEIIDKPDAEILQDVKGHIRYQDVSFTYDDEVDVLKHIDLEIQPGSTLALVGPSGGGKSTLCHLLPRFYETTDGNIFIDGKNIKDLTLKSLRDNIGIVQQDVFLFADTIMENIRYGRLDATDEEVIDAARRAEIHEDITGLPNGYKTYVGERGVMLSGGQKQRVSIARLFLKNPPILILDEATSALDTYTEHRIQEAFERLGEGRTTLVIAHRLSTIKDADEIIVIDNEGIRERGRHKELLANGAEYATLYHTQFEQ
jgi:ATP-binding cassette subfamily B protein